MTAHLQLVCPAPVPAEGLLPQPVHYLRRSAGALSELDPHSLRTHRRYFGTRPSCAARSDAAALVDELDSSELSGCGGAHFPVAVKWRTARAASRKIVVANGAEGEPLSRKDAALLELRPHLVLDGLAVAAEAVRADDAVVWLHEGNHAARVAVSRALAERQDHEDDPPIRVQLGPSSYLSGESSAVANAVVGGPPIPTFRRRSRSPAPAEPAVLVHNIETHARVALLARGNRAATSTTLLSVTAPHGIVVFELDVRATVGDAVRAVNGHEAFHAVLIGGYGGSWVPWHRASELPLHEPSVRTYGLSLGAGVLRPLPREHCGLVEAAAVAAYLARHGAGQCGPCVFGLAAIADSLHLLAEHGRGGRRARREVANLREFVATVTGRGGCHHPDGAARMTETALRTFSADVRAHLLGGCRHRSYGSGRHD
jgi:NADH:ubiquinone oxidoreductase subunit F (NADH-binding)